MRDAFTTNMGEMNEISVDFEFKLGPQFSMKHKNMFKPASTKCESMPPISMCRNAKKPAMCVTKLLSVVTHMLVFVTIDHYSLILEQG